MLDQPMKSARDARRTGSVTAKTLGVSGESVAKTVALFLVLFVALKAAIWPVGIIVMLLVASSNLMRKGAVGPRSFTISDDAFTEDDG
jgi:hypothetical protein